jgi:uncharacterized surface protein with fasciclin (FAS1) repeats
MNDTAALTDLLLYHTIPGVIVESSDLICDDLIEMSNGDFAQTSCDNTTIYIAGMGNPETGYPEVIAADIEACNGVIHVIDQVLL